MDIEEEVYLQHFGVKGMKWGVRNDKKSSEKNESSSKIGKKLLIGGGVIVGAAVLIGGAAYLKKNYGVSTSNLNSSTLSKGKKFVDDAISEPSGIIHATRGKNTGFNFLQTGGLKSAFKEWEAAGGTSSGDGPSFRRYGKEGEKIFARFNDPEGRVDRAGRIIPHEVIIPKSMSKGINTVNDVVQKIWPLIKDGYKYE